MACFFASAQAGQIATQEHCASPNLTGRRYSPTFHPGTGTDCPLNMPYLLLSAGHEPISLILPMLLFERTRSHS